MIIPFLKVIFNENMSEIEPVEFSFNPDQFLGFIDYQLSLRITEWGQVNSLIYLSLGVVAAFLLKNLFIFFFQFNMAYLRSAVVRDMRSKTFKHLLKLPLSYFNKEKRGDIISRLTSDIQLLEFSVMGAIELVFRYPIAVLFPLIFLFLTSFKLTLFVLVLLPVSGYIISKLGSKLKNAAALGQEKLGQVLSSVEESLHGIKIIKAFNAQKDREERFDELNESHFKLMVRLHRKELAASPLSEFMGSIVIAAILVFSGQLILSGDSNLTGSFLIAYIAVFSQILPPAKALSESHFRVKKGEASYDRIQEILTQEEENLVSGNRPAKFENEIEFDKVSFGYDQKLVLKDISFKVNRGETIALVGPSGGGKSTLVDLMPRFHPLSDGAIKLDGVDVRQMDINQLRSLFGIVTQEAILFNDSIANNIKMGDYYSSGDDLLKAAKVANAHEFILDNEEGYNGNIGEKGSGLSGGQRQRLSIARAILKNPPILILDEATSALDTESEKLVQDALDNVTKDRTSFVIAHRLSTIQNANRIFVIEKGEIVQQGSHKELMQEGGVYKNLVDLQTFEQ
jgi:subfamily B ATP-binding cassette protein MsbA